MTINANVCSENMFEKMLTIENMFDIIFTEQLFATNVRMEVSI